MKKEDILYHYQKLYCRRRLDILLMYRFFRKKFTEIEIKEAKSRTKQIKLNG